MESDIFNVRITWKDGLGTTYTNASKIWLDNATRRYIIPREDPDGVIHHSFINADKVLMVDVVKEDESE